MTFTFLSWHISITPETNSRRITIRKPKTARERLNCREVGRLAKQSAQRVTASMRAWAHRQLDDVNPWGV